MALDPRIEKDAGGTFWLRWTPDPTAEGYAFVTPGGSSRTFDPTRKEAKLGKNLPEPVVASVAALDVTARAAESASYPPSAPPPDPVPVPSSAITTNGQSDMTISGKSIVKPPNYTNQNDACIYISGGSQRIHVGPNVILKGSYEALKQYCSTMGAARDIVIDGVDISNAGGDLMHFNGAHNVRVGEHALVHLHAPPPTGGEHHDCIQVQAGEDYYFGPHVFMEWPMNFPDNGFMIVDEPTQPGRYLRNVVIDRCRIYGPKAHNALQLMVSGEIISPDIQGPTGAKVSISRPRDGGKIILRSATTGMWAGGVRRSDVFDNSGGGSSGPWPSYVLVDP